MDIGVKFGECLALYCGEHWRTWRTLENNGKIWRPWQNMDTVVEYGDRGKMWRNMETVVKFGDRGEIWRPWRVLSTIQ